ncbi:phosphotransferase [Lentzea sp. NPDC059081]|uniref:phosphotransferase n=1 Tax=Lentzea sp. NPDC059081 TaxID=3346719 RepID=UPI0036A827CE
MSLPGGWINAVVRVGGTVRRPRHARSSYVHELLRHLGDWPGAPLFLGVDAEGREVLSFVDGEAAWRDEAFARTDANLAEVAALARRMHDLTEGTDLAAGGSVVCHNDLAPKNTVYRDGSPVAFVDWDLAAPGERVHDLAHICWQYPDLGRTTVDVTEAAGMIGVICDGYGFADRGEVVDTVLWWQDRCRRGIETGAAAGDPAMVGLRDHGVPAAIGAARDWVREHRRRLS